MIRVLVLITTGFVPTGGLTSVMMNYYNNMDKHNLQIDFASINSDIGGLKHILDVNNSHYYCLGRRGNVLTYLYRLYKLCKCYDIIHINGNSATTAIELLTAWLAGVKVRINHNHTTMTQYPIAHFICLPLFRRLYTIGLACSDLAGKWLYGKGDFEVLRNAIDTRRYVFSAKLRNDYRTMCNIPNKAFVLGHVGKMNAPKNHKKLIEVFYEFQKTHKTALLLCVGYGPLQKELEDICIRLQIKDKVIFAGKRTDIPGFLSAMDVFVFPSCWEGLGLAVIEAQASGLPCLLSDKIPHEVYLTSNVKFVALDYSPAKWAEMINSIIVFDRERQSSINIEAIEKAGYDIKLEANRLRSLYLSN